MATISVKPDKVIGTINPNIYGHFAEHLGGVIYDGIWVGEDSEVPNIGGIRKDLVEWTKRINPSVIRWPGGCFADKYHWMDGIGPRDKRPSRFGRWADVTETNAFGTHEFIRFCRLVGAKPYIAGNVGTGTSIDLGGLKATSGKQTVLTHKDIHAHNTFEKPNELVPTTSPLSVLGSAFKHTFPPASITMLELEVE